MNCRSYFILAICLAVAAAENLDCWGSGAACLPAVTYVQRANHSNLNCTRFCSMIPPCSASSDNFFSGDSTACAFTPCWLRRWKSPPPPPAPTPPTPPSPSTEAESCSREYTFPTSMASRQVPLSVCLSVCLEVIRLSCAMALPSFQFALFGYITRAPSQASCLNCNFADRSPKSAAASAPEAIALPLWTNARRARPVLARLETSQNVSTSGLMSLMSAPAALIPPSSST